MSESSRYYPRPGTSSEYTSGSRYLNPDDVLARGSGSLADREHKSFFARMSRVGRANFVERYPDQSHESYRRGWASRERKDSIVASANRRVLLPESSDKRSRSDFRTEGGRLEGRSASSSSSTRLRQLGLVEPPGASVSSQRERRGYNEWPDIRDADARPNQIKRKPVPTSIPGGAGDNSYFREMRDMHALPSHYRPGNSPAMAAGRSLQYGSYALEGPARDGNWARLRHAPERHDARLVHQREVHPRGERAIRSFALSSDRRVPILDDY